MLSVSQPAADFAQRAFGTHTDIMPNAVDVAKFNHSLPARPGGDAYHVVFLGRLVKRKGCMSLLKAFALLLRTMPSVRLTIAGDGPQRPALERYIKRERISGSVNFAGFVSEDDKPALLAGADIACFPSLYGESFGIVLIEAMAAGAGVVLGGNNPGYATVLGKQKELLIDPLDIEAFSARLERLLRDERLARRLHKWQRAEVKKYDIIALGPKIEAIYRRAIANQAKNRHN